MGNDGLAYLGDRGLYDVGLPFGYLLLTDATYLSLNKKGAVGVDADGRVPRWVRASVASAEFIPGLLYYRSLTGLTDTSSTPGTSAKPTGTQWGLDQDGTYNLDQPIVEMQMFQNLGRSFVQSGMWNTEGAYHRAARRGLGQLGVANWIGLAAFPTARLATTLGTLDSPEAKTREVIGVLSGSALCFGNGLTMDTRASEWGAGLLGFSSSMALYPAPYDALKAQAREYHDTTVYGMHYGFMGTESLTGGLGAFLITRNWQDSSRLQRSVRGATILATGITMVAGNAKQGTEATVIPLGGLALGAGAGFLVNKLKH